MSKQSQLLLVCCLKAAIGSTCQGNVHKVNRHKALTHTTNRDTQKAAGQTNIKWRCCSYSLISYLYQHAHQITLFTFFSLHIVCLSRCVETLTAEQKLSESVVEINSATLTLGTISVENHFANCAWQCVICFLQYKGQACTPHFCAGVGGCFEDSISRASSAITPTLRTSRIQSGPRKLL